MNPNPLQPGRRAAARKWTPVWLLLAAVWVAIALRLAHLAAKPFWFDECFSAEMARLDWKNFFHVVWWREANMTAYYMLLRGWILFGHSQFFLRSLSVLFSAATIPAVYWLAELLYDRRVAWIAAALFACNGYSVRYAQEARGYALFVLLATLSSAFVISWLGGPSRPQRGGYILASVLAVYTHLYALLLIAVHWLALERLGAPGSSDRASGTGHRLRRAWMIVGLAVLPLIVFVAKTGAGPIRWIHRPRISDLAVFWQQFTGGSNWLLPIGYSAATLAAALPAGKRLWHRDQEWKTWRVQFLLVWLLFPTALTVLLSFARPVFLGRYMIFCLPALMVLVAAGLARLRPLWVMGLALVVFLLLAMQGVSYVYARDFDEERDGSSAATDFILDHSQAGDGIVFHIAEARVPYEFFRSERAGIDTAKTQLGPEILYPRTGDGLRFDDFKARVIPEVLRDAVVGHPRVWAFLIYNSRNGRPDSTTTLLTQILGESYGREKRWQFPKIEVRLYSEPTRQQQSLCSGGRIRPPVTRSERETRAGLTEKYQGPLQLCRNQLSCREYAGRPGKIGDPSPPGLALTLLTR